MDKKILFIWLFLQVVCKCDAQFLNHFFDYVSVSEIDTLDESKLTYREVIFDDYFPSEKYLKPVIDNTYKCDSLKGYWINVSGLVRFTEDSRRNTAKVVDSVAIKGFFILHNGLIMSIDKNKICLRHRTTDETIPLNILYHLRKLYLKTMKYSKFFISHDWKGISVTNTYIIN